MRISKSLLFTLMMFVCASASFGQVERMIKEADNAYKNEAYFAAIDLYKKAYSKENSAEEKGRLLFQIAESYRKVLDLDQQLIWYDKALKGQYSDPIIFLRLAEANHQKGNFKVAIENYKKYKEKSPGDVRADIGLEAAETAQDWMDKPTKYLVENEVLLNTQEYDFAPTWSDKEYNSIIFSSSRQGSEGVEIDERTGESFQDLFTATRDKKGKWSEPVKLTNKTSTLNVNKINTVHNEGSAILTKERDIMFFTRCESTKDNNKGCDIYMVSKVGDDWSEPQMVALKNGKSTDITTCGHPALTSDDSMLIFASDMPGGEGGKDLYIAPFDKANKTVGTAKNLGPEVNTKGNDMFPYVRENGALYFASDGHFGMGGLDIFMAEKTGDNTWGNVQNMKVPINSVGHDFAMVWEGDNDRGFISSDRIGGKGRDDIYTFRMPSLVFALEGYVYDKDTQVPVPEATVKVVGTDGSSFEATTDESGAFTFDQNGAERYIQGETTYSIEVSKPKYLVGKEQISTIGLNESTTFLKEFLITFTDPDKVIEFPEVRYALGKAELLVNNDVNSRDSLDYLYQTLVDNPTIIIELQAHTDSRGDNKSNLDLSQRRAESCVAYLESKGIPRERMAPKGYGETRLRISDAQISKMKTEEEKEAAHQKNRRTEFSVKSFDYVPRASN